MFNLPHAAVKESQQKISEKDAQKGKEDIDSKDVTTDLPFSGAVDDNRDKETSTIKVESSKIESTEVKTTTVGYVEISEKAQEKHFQTQEKVVSRNFTEIESSQTEINLSNSKKKSLSSQHKLITLVMEQEGSPMDSPMTESGQWTDTGISGISGHTGDTGSMSKLSKPNQLDLQDASIDTDLDDLSEMSPMNNEEISTSQQVTTAITESVSSDSQKQITAVTQVEKETTETATSPRPQMKSTAACSPMQFEAKKIIQQEEKSTSTPASTTCDANLSPILFTENKATSPMSEPKMVDASSSPPDKVVMTSAATSPPKPSDLQLTKSTSSPTSSKGKGEDDEKDPLSFEFDMDLSAQDEVEKTKFETISASIKQETVVESSEKTLIELQQTVVTSSHIETSKTAKEALNKQTAVLLSDEEEKLKKDEEETEKEKKDVETVPTKRSGANIVEERAADLNVSASANVDEGVDLSDDNIDRSTIAAYEVQQTVNVETRAEAVSIESSFEAKAKTVSSVKMDIEKEIDAKNDKYDSSLQ